MSSQVAIGNEAMRPSINLLIGPTCHRKFCGDRRSQTLQVVCKVHSELIIVPEIGKYCRAYRVPLA